MQSEKLPLLHVRFRTCSPRPQLALHGDQSCACHVQVEVLWQTSEVAAGAPQSARMPEGHETSRVRSPRPQLSLQGVHLPRSQRQPLKP